MDCSPNPAARRYNLRIAVAMACYTVVLVVSLRLLRTLELEGPLLWLTAAAPAIPILAAIWFMGAFVAEMKDEYQRMRLVRSMLLATGLSLAVFTVLGFLENGGAIGELEAVLAFPVWCFCMGLAQVAANIVDR